jgi:hypothetical protein
MDWRRCITGGGGEAEAASDPRLERFAEGYRMLAALDYRPAAPSDGLGGITVPEEELDLEAEARAYARRCLDEDDAGAWDIGYVDWRFNRAIVLAVEAARLMCAGTIHEGPGPRLVPALLRQAAREYERAVRQDARREG